jgi:hypothetical protein
MAERLREDMRQAVAEMEKETAESGLRRRLRSTMSPAEALEMADRKKAMQEELEAVERKMQETIRRMDDSQRGAARKLREALGDVQQAEISTRMRMVAEYIKQGLAPHAAQGEEMVTRTLEQLRDQVREAERMARAGGPGQEEGLERSLAQLENMRRRLEQAAGAARESEQGEGQQGREGQQPGQGQQGREGQQPGQGQQGRQPGNQGQQGGREGQQGRQGQQAGNQQGQQGQQPGTQPGNQPGGQSQGSSQGSRQQSDRLSPGNRDTLANSQQGGPQRTIGGASNSGNRRFRYNRGPGGIGIWDEETRREMERAMREGARSVPRITRDLRGNGIDQEDLEAIRRFAQGLSNERFAGNPELLTQEYRKLIAILEQLELQVRRQVEEGQGSQVRSTAAEPVPEQYREAVAEYFRRLSESR